VITRGKRPAERALKWSHPRLVPIVEPCKELVTTRNGSSYSSGPATLRADEFIVGLSLGFQRLQFAVLKEGSRFPEVLSGPSKSAQHLPTLIVYTENVSAFHRPTYLPPYTKRRDGKCTPTFKASSLAWALRAWPSTQSTPSTSSLAVIPAILIPQYRFQTRWPHRRYAPSRQLGTAARCKYVSSGTEPDVCVHSRETHFAIISSPFGSHF
jgi:hypothetical protein